MKAPTLPRLIQTGASGAFIWPGPSQNAFCPVMGSSAGFSADPETTRSPGRATRTRFGSARSAKSTACRPLRELHGPQKQISIRFPWAPLRVGFCTLQVLRLSLDVFLEMLSGVKATSGLLHMACQEAGASIQNLSRSKWRQTELLCQNRLGCSGQIPPPSKSRAEPMPSPALCQVGNPCVPPARLYAEAPGTCLTLFLSRYRYTLHPK